MTRSLLPDSDEMHKQLTRLARPNWVVYHNSSKRRDPRLFAMVRKLADQGRIQINQRRKADGTMDYLATGLWSRADLEARRRSLQR